MKLDPVEHHWPQIRETFATTLATNLHYAIASIDASGAPRVTPIGSVMLNGPARGVFFQLFTAGLPKRIKRNEQIAILTVNSGRLFWFNSLRKGRFASPPGVRLNARVLGQPREPTDREIARFQRRVRPFKRLRGYDMLWSNAGMARDFEVLSAETVEFGAMTRGLWERTPTHASVQTANSFPLGSAK